MHTQISELDARILAPEASLANLRRERENLQSLLDYKYPILSLPLEITSEIFINFLPIYPLRPPLTGLLSPTLLGQICHQWREIAFGIPRLWRAIEIYVGSSSDAQLNALTTWLSRSKNCPLSLSFETAPYWLSPKFPNFTAALISQSERWEHIRLMIAFDDLRWLDRPFPLLRDLTFGPTEYYTAQSTIMVFHDAPQLKSVLLPMRITFPRALLPWSQLISIHAEKIDPADAADILRQATSLVRFTCTLGENSNDRVPESVPPLIHLESLMIRAPSWYNTQQLLLDAVTAPVLRHLAVIEYELGEDPISTIAAFLSRSYCSLNSLHVTQSSLPEADYPAVFPSIKDIDVSSLDIDYPSDQNEEEDEGSDDTDDSSHQNEQEDEGSGDSND